MDRALDRIKNLISSGDYEFTDHAEDRMAEYDLEEEEVLTAIERGYIDKKQRDEKREAKWKYTILGDSDTNRQLYVVGKIIEGKLRIFRILSAKEDEG